MSLSHINTNRELCLNNHTLNLIGQQFLYLNSLRLQCCISGSVTKEKLHLMKPPELPYLHDLIVEECSEICSMLMQITTHSKNLNKLHILSCCESGVRSFIDLIENLVKNGCTELTDVVVGFYTFLCDDGLISLVNCAPKLTKLNINGKKKIYRTRG